MLKWWFCTKDWSCRNFAFDINPTTRANIADAIAKFDATIAAHDEEIFQHYGYGKGLIKKFKVSPDAYVQMLMQLAYFKYTGKIRPTYESAATRKFLKGRTETGRTVSNESKKFVETWTNPKATNEEKFLLSKLLLNNTLLTCLLLLMVKVLIVTCLV